MEFIPQSEQINQALRALGHAAYGGGEIGECLEMVRAAEKGGVEDPSRAWAELAIKSHRRAFLALKGRHEMSATQGFLAASNYYRTAAYFLEAERDKIPSIQLWRKSVEAFYQGVNLQKHQIPFERYKLPAFFIPAHGNKAPLLIINGGNDSTLEETFFYSFEPLRRGLHVLLFEGPGQGAVLRDQGVPFRHDWENVIKVVIDYAEKNPLVDTDNILLMGRSFGGCLAARAAAFEKRLRALVVDPGILDVSAPLKELLPEDAKRDKSINAHFEALMQKSPELSYKLRQRFWRYGVQSPAEFLERLIKFDLTAHAEKITAETLVVDNDLEHLSQGQAALFFEVLSCPKKYHRFTESEATGGHCEPLAPLQFSQLVYDWLDEVIHERT